MGRDKRVTETSQFRGVSDALGQIYHEDQQANQELLSLIGKIEKLTEKHQDQGAQQ